MAVLHFSSLEELVYQLSPSEWSKRGMTGEEVIKDHCAVTKAATETARKTTKCTTDIKYCESDVALDIYYPPNSKADYSDCPVFMFFYGGYWFALSKDNGGTMVVPFTKAGIIVVVVGHTPCIDGRGTITSIVNECRSACCFVRKKFPSNRLFLGGHSSGGHLSSCMMCTDWESCKMPNPNFKGVIFLAAYLDLEVFEKHDENSIVQVTSQEAKQFTNKYNAATLSVPKDCKCLFFYGEDDTDEYKKQGKDFMKVLVDKGIECKYEELAGLDHFVLSDNLQFDDFKITVDTLNLIKETDTVS